ncbi:MAG: hypothetical protein J6U01_08580 [Clostridia bacterium]|nr:hypothetical protein [Clostridia bacterium]
MVSPRKCTSCKHRELELIEEPCKTCIHEIGHTKWEPAERIEIKLEKRPEMLPISVPIYERTDSKIPERIRVSFTNGTSAIYDLHTDQPAPVIMENVRIIRKWKQGYINKPMRRRRYRK